MLVSFGLPACGGSAENSDAVKTNPGSSRNSPSNASGLTNNSTEGANVNPAGPINSNDLTPIQRMRQRRNEELKESPQDPNQPLPTLEETLQRSTRPAPENSEFSVALTDILFERRAFRDHPVIAKVEKITKDGKSEITMFLRDGRRMELPANAFESLSTVSTNTILRAAGIQVPAQSPAESKPGVRPKN